MLPIGTAKLYWLIRLYMTGHHDVGTFCKEFEKTYNFEVDRSSLSTPERTVFAELFQKVIFYSPFERDLKEYPAYQSREQIREAVTAACSTLGFKV